MKGRGFSEEALSLSAMPYVVGAAMNIVGGFALDWLAKRVGVRWSRRYVGMAGMLMAAVFIAATTQVAGKVAVILCLSLAYGGITLQQPVVWTACLDIGGTRGGAVSGFMNTAGQFGGAISSVLFGYIVTASGSYDTPLFPMAAFLMMGMYLWSRVDVTRKIMMSPA